MASERRSVMNRVEMLEVSTTPTSRRQRRLSYAHRQRRDEREGAAEAAAPTTMKLKSVQVRGESVDWPEDDLHVVPAPRQRLSEKVSIESRDAPPLRTLSHPQSPRRGSRKSSPKGKGGRRSNNDENTNPVIRAGSSIEWPSENERPGRAEERAPSPLRRDDKSISSRSSKQHAIPQQRVPPPTKDRVDIEQPGSFKPTNASRLSDGLKRSLYDASTVLQEERASSVASSSASLSSDELSSIAMRALKSAQRRSQKEKPNFLDSRSSDVGSASSRSRAIRVSLAKKRTATTPKNLESSKDDSSLASANSSRNSRVVATNQRAVYLRENHDRKYDDSVSVLSANSLRSARFSAAKKRTAHLRRTADNVNDDVPSVTSASPRRPSRGSDFEDARSTASDKLKKKFKDRAHSLASHSMSARTRRSTDADENTISSGDDGSTIVSEMKPPFVPSGFPRKAPKDADHFSQTSHGSPQAGNRHCSPDRTARIPFLPSNSTGYSHRHEFPIDSVVMQQNSSQTTSESVGEDSSRSRDPPGTTEREQAKTDPPLDGTRDYDANLSPSPVKKKKIGPPIVNRHSSGARLILTPTSSHETRPSRPDTDDGSMCSPRSLRSSTREAALQALRGRSPSPTPTGRTPDMDRNLHLHHPARGSSDKSVTSSTASARSPARRRAFEHTYYKKNHHKDQSASPEVRREANSKDNSESPVEYVKGDADFQSTPENSVSSQKERRLKVLGKSKAAWQFQTGYSNNQRNDDMISPSKTRSEETSEGISSKEQVLQQETLEIDDERRAQSEQKKSPRRISDERFRGPGRSDSQHCSTSHAHPVRSPRSSGKRQGTNCGMRKCETKQEQTRNQNDCERRMQRDDRIRSPRRSHKDQRSVREKNQTSLREKRHEMIGSGSARSPHSLGKGDAKSPGGGARETQSRQKGEGGQNTSRQNTSMQHDSPKQARGVPWPTVEQPIQSDQSASSTPKKSRTKPSQQHTSPNESMVSTTTFGSTNVARSPRKGSAWHLHARSEDEYSKVSKSDMELYKASASALRSPTRSLNTETESFTSKDTSLFLDDADAPQSVEAHEKIILSKEKKLASRNAYLTHLEQKKVLAVPLEVSQTLCAPSATPAPFSQVSDFSSTDPVRQRFLNDKSLLDGSSHCEDGTDASSFTRSSEESSMPSTSMLHESVLPRTTKPTAVKSEAASRMNHTVPEDQSVHFDDDHSRSAPLSPESLGSALRKRSLLGPFRTGSSDASEGSILNGEGSTLIGQLHIDSQGSDRSNLKKKKRSKSSTAIDEKSPMRGNDALEWWKENYAGSQDMNVNSIVESALTPTSSGVPFEEGTASVEELSAKGGKQKVNQCYPAKSKGTKKIGYNEDDNFRSMKEIDQELESVFSDGTLFSGLEESAHVKTDPTIAGKNVWGKETDYVGVTSSPGPSGGENHDHFESIARQTEPTPMLSSPLALPPPPPPPPEHFGELLDESQLVAPVNSDITTSIIAEGVKDLVDRNITSTQVIQEEKSDDLTDEDTDRSEAEDIKTGNSLHRSFSRKSQRSSRSRQQAALSSFQDEEEVLHTRQNETTVSEEAEDLSMKEEEHASIMPRGAGREVAATFSSHESGDEYASTAFTNPSATVAGQSTEAPDTGNIGAVFLRFGNSILDSFERVCRFPDEDMPPNNNVDEVKQGVQIVDASDAFSIADSALSGTHSTMNELEASKWDEWDRRDSQSVLSNADTSNDNTRCTDVESQFTEDNVFSRQAMAHKKLLDFSKSAMTHSSQDCSDDDSPSEILSSGVSGSYIDTGDESSMTPEPRSSSNQLQRASKPQNHYSLPSALSLNQRRILEKFCASLKNQGVEVLKQNRDTKWQAKTLTVSKEMADINHVKLAHNKDENCYCPGALLWLKKFNKGSRDYSTAMIDKQGRGGVLLSRLVRVTATGRSDPAQQLPRKYQDKYKDSVTVLMEYNLHGKTRSMALRCKTTDEAHFLCTGLRVCMDILKREKEAI